MAVTEQDITALLSTVPTLSKRGNKTYAQMSADDYSAHLSDIQRLIRFKNAQIQEQPQLSERRTQLVNEQAELVQAYLQGVAAFSQTVGQPTAKNNTISIVKTVPSGVLSALSGLSDESTRLGTTIAAATTISGLSPDAGRQKMPSGWAIKVKAPTKTAVPKEEVKPDEPVTPGGQPTTPGGQQVTPGGGKTVRGPKLSEEQIIAKFREMFPTQAWLTEADPTKYPGLRKVIRNAVEGKMWSSTQGQARFDAQFRASDFYRELASTDKIRQIKTLVGDLGFDSKPFNTFVKDAMNFGWEGDTLKQEVYKEVFRKDDTTGAFVNPTAVERTRKSAPYLQLQNVGKAYFNTVSDTTIQNVLTGGMSSEDVARQQREFAKTKYAHLSNLIDQGLTLDDISQPFRKQAAQMLERSEDDIDMSTADFEVAFNVGEEGKKRIMTTGEWNRALRTNKVFGWDKTDGAKREAREIAASIVQAFGRVI